MISKLLEVAGAEVGYLEKSSSAVRKNPTVLYERTAGAGYDNFTKYGKEMHEIYPAVMDYPAAWCDAFVDWCFYKAFGVATAKSLLGGNFDDYTVASAAMYQKHGALDRVPDVGAQIFFSKSGNTGTIYHTGLVYKVDGTYVYTIEGNTSNGSAVVANGGGVHKKKYHRDSKAMHLAWYGHPKYQPDMVKPKSPEQVAREVLAGMWGNGDDRKARITAAGYDYSEVQKAVNALTSKKSNEEVAREVLAGKWGNGTDRVNRLKAAGYDPAAVQKAVNKLV